MSRKPNHSASSIAAFKACPVRYLFAHELGVRLDEDPDTQRQGSNWHGMMEVYRESRKPMEPLTYCGIEVKGQRKLDPVQAAVDHLNECYKVVPASKTAFEWDTERTWLMYAFMVYCWYYADDEFETIATEHRFSLPIINPETGRPDRTLAPLVGMIDHMLMIEEREMVHEYKTMASDISQKSEYWAKLRLDTQVSTYSYAARRLGWNVVGTFYDVFRKPRIRPRLLSAGEVKKFMKDHEWCGGVFEVEVTYSMEPTDKRRPIEAVIVNNVKSTELKLAATFEKTGAFQFRETTAMYGARLAQTMYETPSDYFVRREITRTDKELRVFEAELYNIAQTMKLMSRNNAFYHNEQQCEHPYPCPYRSICYHGRTQEVIDGATPSTFKRIFGDSNDQAPTPAEGPPEVGSSPATSDAAPDLDANA